MNPSMAGEMLLTDISTGKWDEDMCQLVGIRSDQLSPIQPSDAVIGPITQETCRQTGLAQGTVLINGGQDHSCEALAVGMITKGKAMLACGTAWVINSVIEDLAADSVPEMMNVNFHVLPDLWTISQFLGGLGAASEWWLNQCWQSTDPQTKISREALYSNFNKALADTSPGCNGLTFHPLSGSMQFSSGLDSGGFLGLRLAHSRADMSRAVMEGAAYELRWALEPIKNTGMVIDQLWMIGGAARSRIWTQIVADVSGVQISLSPYSHGPALGAAILAGAGLGIHNTIDESRARFSVTAEHVHPQAKNLVVYETAFREYQQLTKRLHQKRG